MNILRFFLAALACLSMASCAALSGSGDRIDAAAMYRAQDQAFRPVGD
jgi:hypothetical protein